MNKSKKLPRWIGNAINALLKVYFLDGFYAAKDGHLYPLAMETSNCSDVIEQFPYPPAGGKYIVVHEAKKAIEK